MNARLDLMKAMAERDFPQDVVWLKAKFEGYRRLYPWLSGDALQEAQLALDASVSALETAARIKRVAVDPGGNQGVTAAIATLNEKLTNLLGALLTTDLAASLTEVDTARDDWLNNVADAFVGTAMEMRKDIATEISPDDYGQFSDGLPYHILSAQRDNIASLEERRSATVHALDAFIDAAPDASQSLEARTGYATAHSENLNKLQLQAESVVLRRSLCEQGKLLADNTLESYQINQDNAAALNMVASALAKIVGGVPTRDGMDRLRSSSETAFNFAGERIESIATYERRVTWFTNIAATLIGIGAMRAVMAVPEVAALGRTGAGIVGSLTFTGTRLVLTNNQGRPWSVGGVAGEAVKDYFLFPLLGGVDARITARLGESGLLANAARLGGAYGTLAAWALVWNKITPPPLPPGAKPASTGEILLQTGVDLAGALTIAGALMRAPEMPSDALMDPRRAAEERSRVMRAGDAHRAELQETGRNLRNWLESSREDVAAGDALMKQAHEQVGRTRGFARLFEQMGEITADQRTQLEAHTTAMQEMIRNARDEVRLGVRPVTGETWSYQGSADNVAAYLARLQQQGRVTEIRPESGGVFSVRTADGSLQWFFPRGGSPPWSSTW